MTPLWVMVCGPYTSGGADAAQRERNLAALNEAALAVLERGHVPIVGVNLALPMVAAAGDPEAEERILLPVSLALAERCDACVRIGGPSRGADAEVAAFAARGAAVFERVEDLPRAS